MGCDMCGKEGSLVDAIVEGSMLKVCSECSKHGVVVVGQKEEKQEEVREIPVTVEPTKQGEEIDVIINNYSQIIKVAREKKGLTQEELAKDIGEKESVIVGVESGNMKPDFKLAGKLNIYLKINLIEKAEKVDFKKDKKDIDFKDKTVTIGDLLKK
jgi:putative transcription factor